MNTLKLFLCFLFIFIAVGIVAAQQVQDSSFNTAIDNPTYKFNGPVVAFDEGHNNVFRIKGRSQKFIELIENDGYKVISHKGAFTNETLKKYQVLLITTPSVAEDKNPVFTSEEMQSVYDWVNNGGSLLLMSEHPPFDSITKELIEKMGAKTSIGIVNDSINYYKTTPEQEFHKGWIMFTHQNGGLGKHPILSGRNQKEQIRTVITNGGASVSGPKGSYNLLQLSKSAKIIKHRAASFTTTMENSQAVAYTLGKGRVVITGDATMFTAQRITMNSNVPTFVSGLSIPESDNRQFALNVMHWLSGALK